MEISYSRVWPVHLTPTDSERPDLGTTSPVRSVSQLVDQIRALGVQDGQTVLVRAAAKALGPAFPRPVDSLLDALVKAVGPRGTIMTLTHSPIFFRWRRPPHYAFTAADAPVSTGGLAGALAGRSDAYRSEHPTNSIAALGPLARALLQSHGPLESSFEPIRRLADAGGHMVVVGCTTSSPGFSTVHVAQHILGLATRSVFSGMLGSPYRTADDQVRWFTRHDHPGCSVGFSRLYPVYRERGLLQEGLVGDAASIGIAAGPALATELEALRADPCASACERPACTDCAMRSYAASRWLPYFMAKIGQLRSS